MGDSMEQKQHLGQEVRIVSNLLKRTIDNTAVKQRMDHLTGTQCWIIGYMYANQNKDIFQKDIEMEFSIRRSTVTGIIKLLEKNELITRESVSYDARLKKLVLTEKAIELHHEIMSEIYKVEDRLTEGITSEEKEVFLKVVEKMKQNLI